MKLTRRKFFKRVARISILPVGIGLYTWRIEPHWLSFTHRDLPLPNLPAELENKTLIHISDLHTGTQVDSNYIINSLKKINQLKPDILAITGDFISYDSSHQFDELSRVMEHLPSTTLGTFGILGNHDYGHGWRQDEVAGEVAKRVKNSGIQLLRNQSANLKGLNIAGIEDFWAPHFITKDIANAFPDDSPSLILSHNPDSADHKALAEAKGYMLCGHTHGGQCKPPFLPPPLLPVQNKRYVSGEIKIREDLTMYINKGLGYLIRVRFNVRPEVTVFTLKKLA
jgi:predicted MPP superfamily phosphohydrolase